MSEFSKGKRVFRHTAQRTERAYVPLDDVLHNRRRYNPFTNNCEHTVSRVVSGHPQSRQVQNIIAGSVPTAACFALTFGVVVGALGYRAGSELSRRMRTRRTQRLDPGP
ncbi:MAG: hypothetical protein J4F97_06215 [Pseudomonadales bacterium]|nr:hypothetical protein [Pseudomonadales bacterium]